MTKYTDLHHESQATSPRPAHASEHQESGWVRAFYVVVAILALAISILLAPVVSQSLDLAPDASTTLVIFWVIMALLGLVRSAFARHERMRDPERNGRK